MLQGKENNRERVQYWLHQGFGYFEDQLLQMQKKVILITKSVVALHNFLMKKRASQDENYSYCPPFYVDQESRSGIDPGDWRKEETIWDGLQPIQKLGSNNYSKSAKEMRDRFKNYFCSPEVAVEWQVEKVIRTYNQ